MEDISKIFEQNKYVADEKIALALFLAIRLEKPLLIEGEPGCGKTEIAKVLSEGLKTKLIRLQCYEGLDVNTAIYEWDYLRQLLSIRIEEARKSTTSKNDVESEIFSERFLLKRPLLEAITDRGDRAPVLLIDEIDRADEEFEGFLLELLAEFQVSIPELGTFKAKRKPIIIITSNRTRELGDGLRRRCLYLYLSYPNLEKELKIVELKVPDIKEKLGRQIVSVVSKIRSSDEIIRKPGTAETLDWALAIVALGQSDLTPGVAKDTLSCVIKNPEELRILDEKRIAVLISQSASEK